MSRSGAEPIVYLDYNATAPLRREALAATCSALATVGNPSSVHAAGRAALAGIETARRQIAELLGCSPGEITFTSGATEANNIALRSVAEAGKWPLIISAVEHPAVMEAAFALAGPHSGKVRVVPVTAEGILDLIELRIAVEDGAGLVSVMAANNETGVLNDLQAVAKITHDAGAVFHTDATQLVGRLPIDVNDLGIDMLSLSAHKFGGPQGVGALYVRRGLSLLVHPIAYGGGHERGRRPGTYNVAGIVGLGAAAQAARMAMADEVSEIRSLRDRLEQGVLSAVEGARPNGRLDCRLPGVSSVTFLGAPADAILAAMPSVAASVGSACASGTIEPSRVLLAMGLPRDEAECTLRFSIGHATTQAEIDWAVGAVVTAVQRVRDSLHNSSAALADPTGRKGNDA